MTFQEKKEKEGKDRVGMTIKNFKLLDHKREKRYGYHYHLYFIRCLLCGNEKWMGYYSITSPKVRGCGCYNRKISTKDLTGQQFGRLTVISKTDEKTKFGNPIWLCECICGNRKRVSAPNLRAGHVRSCGCPRERFVNAYSAIIKGERENIDPKDQIGITINNHKLLDYKHEKNHHYYYFLCLWCGKEKWKQYYAIINSRTKSCGCQRDYRYNDLTGQQFGRLTAIYPTEKRNGKCIVWHCECLCGGGKEVSSSDLLKSFTKSCGCLQAEHAVKVVKDRAKKVLVEKTNLDSLTMKTQARNISGIKGVHWNKQTNKWGASMKFQGKTIYLGYFENIEAAVAVRKEAEEKYFKPMLEKYKDRLNPKQLDKLNNEIGQ